MCAFLLEIIDWHMAQSHPWITPPGKPINNSSEENDHTQKTQLVYYDVLCKLVSNSLYVVLKILWRAQESLLYALNMVHHQNSDDMSGN